MRCIAGVFPPSPRITNYGSGADGRSPVMTAVSSMNISVPFSRLCPGLPRQGRSQPSTPCTHRCLPHLAPGRPSLPAAPGQRKYAPKGRKVSSSVAYGLQSLFTTATILGVFLEYVVINGNGSSQKYRFNSLYL